MLWKSRDVRAARLDRAAAATVPPPPPPDLRSSLSPADVRVRSPAQSLKDLADLRYNGGESQTRVCEEPRPRRRGAASGHIPAVIVDNNNYHHWPGLMMYSNLKNLDTLYVACTLWKFQCIVNVFNFLCLGSCRVAKYNPMEGKRIKAFI